MNSIAPNELDIILAPLVDLAWVHPMAHPPRKKPAFR